MLSLCSILSLIIERHTRTHFLCLYFSFSWSVSSSLSALVLFISFLDSLWLVGWLCCLL